MHLHEAEPDELSPIANLAFIYAAADDDASRDAKDAMKFAKLACKVSDNKSVFAVAVLSLAHAESGDFDSAIQSGREAMDLGRKLEQSVPSWLPDAMNLYQQQQTWRFNQENAVAPEPE